MSVVMAAMSRRCDVRWLWFRLKAYLSRALGVGLVLRKEIASPRPCGAGLYVMTEDVLGTRYACCRCSWLFEPGDYFVMVDTGEQNGPVPIVEVVCLDCGALAAFPELA
jgi:hypothetical protein